MMSPAEPFDRDEAELMELLGRPRHRSAERRTDALEIELSQAAVRRLGLASEQIALDIPKDDLERLKAKAKAKGVSYETLINGLIEPMYRPDALRAMQLFAQRHRRTMAQLRDVETGTCAFRRPIAAKTRAANWQGNPMTDAKSAGPKSPLRLREGGYPHERSSQAAVSPRRAKPAYKLLIRTSDRKSGSRSLPPRSPCTTRRNACRPPDHGASTSPRQIGPVRSKS